VERTALELDAERIHRNLAVLLVQPFRAGVLVALVTEHAVVNLAEDFAWLHAGIGEREPVAAAETPVGAEDRRRRDVGRPCLDEMPVIECFGKAKDHPRAERWIVQSSRAPAFDRFAVQATR